MHQTSEACPAKERKSLGDPAGARHVSTKLARGSSRVPAAVVSTWAVGGIQRAGHREQTLLQR